jgi:hypothetical protein
MADANPTPNCPVIWGPDTTWTAVYNLIQWCPACARYCITVALNTGGSQRVFVSADYQTHAREQAAIEAHNFRVLCALIEADCRIHSAAKHRQARAIEARHPEGDLHGADWRTAAQRRVAHNNRLTTRRL